MICRTVYLMWKKVLILFFFNYSSRKNFFFGILGLGDSTIVYLRLSLGLFCRLQLIKIKKDRQHMNLVWYKRTESRIENIWTWSDIRVGRSKVWYNSRTELRIDNILTRSDIRVGQSKIIVKWEYISLVWYNSRTESRIENIWTWSDIREGQSKIIVKWEYISLVWYK